MKIGRKDNALLRQSGQLTQIGVLVAVTLTVIPGGVYALEGPFAVSQENQADVHIQKVLTPHQTEEYQIQISGNLEQFGTNPDRSMLAEFSLNFQLHESLDQIDAGGNAIVARQFQDLDWQMSVEGRSSDSSRLLSTYEGLILRSREDSTGYAIEGDNIDGDTRHDELNVSDVVIHHVLHSYSPVFPRSEISVGTSWEASEELELEDLGVHIEETTSATFLGHSSVSGRSCAVLQYERSHWITVEENESIMGLDGIVNGRGVGTDYICVDVEKGYILGGQGQYGVAIRETHGRAPEQAICQFSYQLESGRTPVPVEADGAQEE